MPKIILYIIIFYQRKTEICNEMKGKCKSENFLKSVKEINGSLEYKPESVPKKG